MSNTDSGFSTFNFGAENGFNQKAEWSISGNDQTHILNMAGVYELPIGPGKKFVKSGMPGNPRQTRGSPRAYSLRPRRAARARMEPRARSSS